MRDDRLRLADTLEAIGQIEKYSQRGRAAFDENELIRVWIFHHLQIIGEACRTTFGKRIRTRCGPTLWGFGMFLYASTLASILRRYGKSSCGTFPN
jgi:uncharacterized protein with HEPN domain